MASPSYSSTLVFYVNGIKIEDSNVDPECSLLSYLRQKLRLCGAKLGCGEGGCGACTVMVSKYDREHKRIEHLSINACLAPVCSMHGLAVTTVEGIGSTREKLHPVQERIYKSHGSQCGFCTPGIVMSMYTLLRNNNQPSLNEIETYFQGNLCRCTGYRPILESCKSFTDSCCRGNNTGCKIKSNQCCLSNGFLEEDPVSNEASEFVLYDETQEPIFPPELQISDRYDKECLKLKGKEITWFRPTNLQNLLELKDRFHNAKLLVGNTEIGIEMKFKGCHYPVLIAADSVPELNVIKWQENGITIGAAVTLSKLNEILLATLNKIPKYKSRGLSAIMEMLKWFAGQQIRNVASLGGNIVTASPISDLNPILMVTGAQLYVMSKAEDRTVPMDQKFFSGYRKTLLKDNEILVSIFIPYTLPNEYVYGFKQAQRREDDISIVNAGMRVLFDGNSDVIQQISLAFGGMAPTTVFAKKTMEQLSGKRWTESLVKEGCQMLLDDLPLDPGAPGGMVTYRRTLTLSFFFKFYLKVLDELQKNECEIYHSIPEKWVSAGSDFTMDFPKGSQYYQVTNAENADDPVGLPIPHQSGAVHTTGEAVYCEDLPNLPGQLYVSFVTSTKAHAQILSIDSSAALALNGVHAFFTADDLPGERNFFGVTDNSMPIFARDEVNCQGQIIGAVIAEDKSLAKRAAQLVKVDYQDLHPIILTIKDAIDANSFFHKYEKVLRSGEDVNEILDKSDHVIEGEMSCGGQDHFYMETHSGQVTTGEELVDLTLTVSCQGPSDLQKYVSKALDIPTNRIVVKTKRLGGGFGGKGFQAAFCAIPAALAAYKLRHPVRYSLERDEDMIMTGGRHPCLVKYKVGFTSRGKVTALSAKVYGNAGHALDCSALVMKKCLEKFTSAYNIPVCELFGFICKTNLQSNTAYRGFGAPQSQIFMDSIMGDIAAFLDKEPTYIRELNLYSEGDRTFYGQELTDCTISKCWEECLQRSAYALRKKAVDAYNRENRWKKRGIAVVPVMYGIGLAMPHMNQGAALVHVYTDGSVLVTHGGVEMGQGLHIKTLQVASRVLGIPLSKVHLSETSTDKVPNTTKTAGSVGTDLYAAAVQNACDVIMERLEPYVKSCPKGKWEEWVCAAYKDRISLSATGFYKTNTRRGDVYHYFSFGAACSEVEVDCLTGDHHVLRTDIVMDVGESLNPAIDIGQIEGAFIQGYGLYMMEELKYSPEGYLYTRGPGTYKIPSFGDIPREFNVSLLKGSPNVHAIYSSKAVGEPPLLLASSVFFAVKDALVAARTEAGIRGIVRLDSPATPEKVRMACTDEFIVKVEELERTSKTVRPWSISVT